MTCHVVLNAVGEPWAEQMLVRGRRFLAEQASLIADEELRRSFCENISTTPCPAGLICGRHPTRKYGQGFLYQILGNRSSPMTQIDYLRTVQNVRMMQ